MPGLLDIILGYDCNLACDYCTITPAMRSRALPPRAVVAALREGQRLEYDAVAFTGGEPTIRGDLLALIRAARDLGFADIKVQSNGLLFSPGNLAKMLEAGVTRLHISIHTHLPAAYDALVQRPGAFPAMLAGLGAAVATDASVVADLIVNTDTFTRLPAAVTWLADLGVTEAHLWFVSLTDGNAERTESMPEMRTAVPFMREAMAVGRSRGVDVKSLHVPRCLLGEDWTHAWDPGDRRVMVVTPESTFELRDSRLAGQSLVPACAGCRFESHCPGLREDYLAHFGDLEVACARGVEASIQGKLRLPIAPDA